MNKPSRTPNRTSARPLGKLVGKTLADVFQRQGFASPDLVSHWADIVGPDIANHAQPLKIQWPRAAPDSDPEPATLVLRVEGPAAIEIQHASALILERVNRFFGWPAVGRLALRQGPLYRPPVKSARPKLDPAAADRVAAGLGDVADDALRAALGRLGAAVKKQ